MMSVEGMSGRLEVRGNTAMSQERCGWYGIEKSVSLSAKTSPRIKGGPE